MKEEEIWKDVKNYEGHYKVSNIGRVKSIKFKKEKVLSPYMFKGCHAVCLNLNGTRKTKKTEQLVKESFLGYIPLSFYQYSKSIKYKTEREALGSYYPIFCDKIKAFRKLTEIY